MRRATGRCIGVGASTTPWSPAVTTSIAIAARWGSNLTGCFVDPLIRMLGAADAEPSVLALLIEPRVDYADESAAFSSLARQSGVHDASWTIAHAGVAQTLQQLGA